jgi:uncharacterized protein
VEGDRGKILSCHKKFFLVQSTGTDTITKSSKELIILFTRYPEPGKVKTRLIPALGAEGACALQRRMTDQVLLELKRLSELRLVSVEVCYDGGSQALMEQWGGPDFRYLPQGQGDLGSRMDKAFLAGFQHGYERIILIGSDCPSLSNKILLEALESLVEQDLVLGPAHDGGYYLIGLKRRISSMFKGIPWGTGDVLSRTLVKANRHRLKIHLLESLADVDRPEDLPLP